MDELLQRRIMRALESLTDEQAQRVLDYVEFLQSKYGQRSPSTFERFANNVEDTLRVGRVPMVAIKGTREVFNTAERVMQGLADAGRVVVEGVQDQIKKELAKEESVPDSSSAATGNDPAPPADGSSTVS